MLEDKLALLWVLADLQFVRWIKENMRDPSKKTHRVNGVTLTIKVEC